MSKGNEYHKQGFNCAQSTFLELAPDIGISPEVAAKVASGFGAGMRCGGLCGTTTGAVMALGYALGNDRPDDQETKDRINRISSEFGRRFRQRFGAMDCKDLLGCNITTPEGKALMDQEPERKQTCSQVIAGAAEIARELLAEEGKGA